MALTYFNAAVSAASGNGVPAGVFFPVGLAKTGLKATEISSAPNTTTKESKSVLAVLALMKNSIPADVLGIEVTQTNVTVDNEILNAQYNATFQFAGKFSDKSFGLLEAPSIGDKVEGSVISLKDMNASIAKIDAEGAITGEGFLIPTADLITYGSPTHNNLNIAIGQDNRDWIVALFYYLARTLQPRSTSKQSAIISSSVSNVLNFIMPANADDAENPTTGYSTSEITNLITRTQQSVTITVQVKLDTNEFSFDAHVE